MNHLQYCEHESQDSHDCDDREHEYHLQSESEHHVCPK